MTRRRTSRPFRTVSLWAMSVSSFGFKVRLARASLACPPDHQGDGMPGGSGISATLRTIETSV